MAVARGRGERAPEVALPDDLPVAERDVIRLVVLDCEGDVLLLHTHDPTNPQLGVWWELPGGGIEDGETYLETAIRELAEETGIAARPEQVAEPTWRRDATYRHRGARRLQHEQVAIVRLDIAAPPVDGSRRVGFEDEDYFGFRWWPVAELAASAERFYPGRLPALLGGFLAGDTIHEPFEHWPCAGQAG